LPDQDIYLRDVVNLFVIDEDSNELPDLARWLEYLGAEHGEPLIQLLEDVKKWTRLNLEVSLATGEPG
jgi:hypothetical protein